MVTSWKKTRRTSTQQASPRGTRKSRVREFFEAESSSSPSPSPPRRRDVIKTMVVKIVRPRNSSIEPAECMPDPETKNYVGVRYREELQKFVTEIRPARSTKKIWLGTYDTAEEAARAFDIGNLCCKKNLPLNFQDSPRMLRKISSRLSPDEARNAIAKLAKEVARLMTISTPETEKAKEVDRAAAEKAHELLHQEAVEPEPELQTQHLEAGFSSCTYTERIEEEVVVMEEMATSMPIQFASEGGSWSFDISRMFPSDEEIVPIHELINFGSGYGDVLVHSYP